MNALISLHYFGLESGYTLDQTELMKESTLVQVEFARDIYDLSRSKDDMYTWLNDITGQTIFTDQR